MSTKYDPMTGQPIQSTEQPVDNQPKPRLKLHQVRNKIDPVKARRYIDDVKTQRNIINVVGIERAQKLYNNPKFKNLPNAQKRERVKKSASEAYYNIHNMGMNMDVSSSDYLKMKAQTDTTWEPKDFTAFKQFYNAKIKREAQQAKAQTNITNEAGREKSVNYTNYMNYAQANLEFDNLQGFLEQFFRRPENLSYVDEQTGFGTTNSDILSLNNLLSEIMDEKNNPTETNNYNNLINTTKKIDQVDDLLWSIVRKDEVWKKYVGQEGALMDNGTYIEFGSSGTIKPGTIQRVLHNYLKGNVKRALEQLSQIKPYVKKEFSINDGGFDINNLDSWEDAD
tara:strand:+ start:681 stop:1694 length:1014 start_codon:yes stop_codon:yes gene_type:complete